MESFAANITEITGLVAGCLTTFSFLPQLAKTWRRKSAKGISLRMYICLSLGIALWLAYGILITAWPVILANGLSLVFCLMIIALRLTYPH